jgi:hypothetical protein
MPRTGIEPARDLIPRGPKPRVSASSTTSATTAYYNFFEQLKPYFYELSPSKTSPCTLK